MLYLAFSLVAPASASGAVTFGPDLSAVPDEACGSCAALTLIRIDGAAETGSPAAAVLETDQIKTRDNGGVGTIRVLSPTGVTDQYVNGGDVPISVTADASPEGHLTTVPARVPIQIGDRLGVSFPSVISPRYLNSDPDALYAIRVEDPPGSPLHARGSPALYDMHGGGTKAEALVAGTVEPDADHDGFGDETQDRCPVSAGFQGVCPATAIPSQGPRKKCKRKRKGKSATAAKKKRRCKKKRKK
jgi:hypothetical protein